MAALSTRPWSPEGSTPGRFHHRSDKTRVVTDRIHPRRERIMRARRDLQRRPVPIGRGSLRRRLIGATSVALCILAAGSPARAQSAKAEALFDDGNRLMAGGKLAQACEAFEASNRIEPRAGTLIRLGDCREQNRQLASAWSAYKDASKLATDPRKQKFATTRAASLEPRLSYLTIAVPDQTRIRGLV